MRQWHRFLVCGLFTMLALTTSMAKHKWFPADHPSIRYTGRIDFSDPKLPRYSAPGVYVTIAFTGTSFDLRINDEILWGTSHNYITVAIDGTRVERIKLQQKENVLSFNGLSPGNHTVVICKSTEANIGFVEFAGIRCEKLLPLRLNDRRIEFIGNSITCGTGSDQSLVKCKEGAWHDQHNAYEGYAIRTARNLDAEWMLTAYSGIGLIRSCCDLPFTMPDIYDKVNMRENKDLWRFEKYQPDVVSICLGQNDGIQDSLRFCSAYVDFIKRLRGYYPKATLLCLSSPMADATLLSKHSNYINGVTAHLRQSGDQNIHQYFFTRRYHNGCDDHPDLQEHARIAEELTSFIRQIKNW
jgi:hypothetical protein